jgi:hypothetical protein
MSDSRDLERRVKRLEDRQGDPGVGCFALLAAAVVFGLDWWLGGQMIRDVLRPWTGQ